MMKRYSTYDWSWGTIIVAIVLIIIIVLSGGWSSNYILQLFGKDIPFVFDIIIGVFTGQVIIPIAVVVYILKLCGVF